MCLLPIIKCWVGADLLTGLLTIWPGCNLPGGCWPPLGTLHTRCRPSGHKAGDGDYWSRPRPLNTRASHNVGIITPSWSPGMQMAHNNHTNRGRKLLIAISIWIFKWMIYYKKCKNLISSFWQQTPILWACLQVTTDGWSVVRINWYKWEQNRPSSFWHPGSSLVTRCLCKHGH